MTRHTKLGENTEARASDDHDRRDEGVHALATENVRDPPEDEGAYDGAERAEPVTQLVSVVLRCHWAVTIAATVPMTNRSYASVKKPMPEMSTARRWSLLLAPH